MILLRRRLALLLRWGRLLLGRRSRLLQLSLAFCRALAGTAQQPSRLPPGKESLRSGRGGARVGDFVSPAATFWAGVPRRPAHGRPQTLRGTAWRPVSRLKKDLHFIFKS